MIIQLKKKNFLPLFPLYYSPPLPPHPPPPKKETAIVKFSQNDLVPWQDCLPEAHFGLKSDFVDLSHNIEKRNLECRRNQEVPYPYFLPYNCNTSINI